MLAHLAGALGRLPSERPMRAAVETHGGRLLALTTAGCALALALPEQGVSL